MCNTDTKDIQVNHSCPSDLKAQDTCVVSLLPMPFPLESRTAVYDLVLYFLLVASASYLDTSHERQRNAS